MIPDLAIECSLAKIRPPNSPAGEGEWSPKATALMNSECLNNVQGNLAIEVGESKFFSLNFILSTKPQSLS